MTTLEPTVVIVDDDPAYSESLSLLIQSLGLNTKSYASADEFLEAFDPQLRGCIILDVRMPRKSGLELQEQLTQKEFCPPVLILTGHAEVPTVVRAMHQGAAKFLEKTFQVTELREALSNAIALDAEKRQFHARQKELTALFAQLTTPDHEVLNLILAGQANKEMASTLNLSIRAIEDRRARLMRKLNVETVPQLVALAIEAEHHRQ